MFCCFKLCFGGKKNNTQTNKQAELLIGLILTNPFSAVVNAKAGYISNIFQSFRLYLCGSDIKIYSNYSHWNNLVMRSLGQRAQRVIGTCFSNHDTQDARGYTHSRA